MTTLAILIFSPIILFILWLQPPYYRGPKSDHFDGRVFANVEYKHNMSFAQMFDFIKWKLSRLSLKRIISKQRLNKIVIREAIDLSDSVKDNELKVTNVGHATFLIQTAGLNILTDPVWSERASPIRFIGPNRIVPPGIDFDKLPRIDIVWVSHNHYDHLDLKTIDMLWKKHNPRVIVPLGTDSTIKSFNKFIKLEAYDWGESVDISENVKFYLSPMHHWSARQIFDQRKALWAALVIDTPGGKIYFVGDTAYAEGINFRKIHEKFGKLRLAILPMGAYEPRWFMKDVHMNPDDFVRAHIDLGMPMTIPTHYDVFQLTDEDYGQALVDLDIAMKKYNLGQNICPMNIGETRAF